MQDDGLGILIWTGGALSVAIGLTAMVIGASWNLEPEHPVTVIAQKLDAVDPGTHQAATPPVRWKNPLVGTWKIVGIQNGERRDRIPLPESAGIATFEFTETTLTLRQSNTGQRQTQMTRPYSYKRGQDNEVIIRMTDTKDQPVGEETTLRLVDSELYWLGQKPFTLVFEKVS